MALEEPAPETNAVIAQTNNAPVETPQQTATEEAPGPWKLIAPTIGVLLVAVFAFFKFRKQ